MRRRITSPSAPPASFSLKIASLLAKGATWYGSLGFVHASLQNVKESERQTLLGAVEKVQNGSLSSLSEHYASLIEDLENVKLASNWNSIRSLSPQVAKQLLDEYKTIVDSLVGYLDGDHSIGNAMTILLKASQSGEARACIVASDFTSLFRQAIVHTTEGGAVSNETDVALLNFATLIKLSNMKIELSNVSV